MEQLSRQRLQGRSPNHCESIMVMIPICRFSATAIVELLLEGIKFVIVEIKTSALDFDRAIVKPTSAVQSVGRRRQWS